MPRVKDPTIKERAFAREVVKTGKGKTAAMTVYNPTTEASARAIASQKLRNPRVQAEILRLLGEIELETVNERSIGAGIASIAFDRAVTDANRLKGLELLAKWKAMLTEKVEQTTVDLTKEALQKAAGEILEDLKALKLSKNEEIEAETSPS